MKKWEYLIKSFPWGVSEKDTVALNELGKDGWEIVTVHVEVNNLTTCIFKRPIE